MPKVTFLKLNKSVEVEYATRLIDVCRENNFPVVFGCGGDGRCGSCLVKIIEGAENLSTPRQNELNKLRDVCKTQKTHRYACMSRVIGDVVIDN